LLTHTVSVSFSLVHEPSGVFFIRAPPRPEWLWGPPSLLYNGYQGLFPKAVGAWSWPLTSI